jgi:circadian clock protein KaiB
MQKWNFRLYIAGNAPNSRRAIANLAEICQACELDDFELEIVDILKDPQCALRDGILVTPTLVRVCPEPVCKITGNLSERSKVMEALGLNGEV